MPPARNRGSITLEILIAFAVLSLVLASVILLESGEDSSSLSREDDELALAEGTLAGARALAVNDFFSITSSSSLAVLDLTPCLKSVTTSADTLTLSTVIADVKGVAALGGDCALAIPSSSWTSVSRFASDDMAGAAGTSLDVRDGIAYVGVNQPPYFLIADVKNAKQGGTSGLVIPFQNGFALPAYPNALDATVFHDSSGDKQYVYLAMNASTTQLAVIDATDPANPVLIASRTVANVDSTGSFPQGWRIKYYYGRLYVSTRETKGAELHIFDVSDPANPIEFGGGTSVDITLNGFEIRNEYVSGVLHRFLYAATARDSGELAVYDVTNPSAVSEVLADRTDLPGNQDGDSIALVGSRLYLGRESVPSGPDLYVYDASSTATGLALLGSADIGTSIMGINVVGSFAYLSTAKSGKQVQVWNVADPAHMTLLSAYAFSGLPAGGLDYENDRLYGAGNASPLFQILSGN